MSKRILCILLALMMMPAMLFMNYDMVAATEEGTTATEDDTTATEGGVTALDGEGATDPSDEGATDLSDESATDLEDGTLDDGATTVDDEGDAEPGDGASDIEAFPQVVQWGELLQKVGFRQWTDRAKGQFTDVSSEWMWDSDYPLDYRLETLGEYRYIAWMCTIVEGEKQQIPDSSSYEFLINVKPRVPTSGSVKKNINTTPGKTLEDLIPSLGSPNDINGIPLAGKWSWKNIKWNDVSSDTKLNEIGSCTKYIAVFTPISPNYHTRYFQITINVNDNTNQEATNNPIVEPESWGKPVKVDGQTLYFAPDGTVSAEVKNEGLVWLTDKPDGEGTWCAMDNTDGQFEPGSRFWVRWASKDGGSDLVGKYIKVKDEEKEWIFLAGVTSPEGTEYTDLEKPVNLYIQLGDAWDKDDINAVFISDGKEENLEVQYKDSLEYPGGTEEFAVLKLKHF